MLTQMLGCLKPGLSKLLVFCWQTQTHLLESAYKQIIHYLACFVHLYARGLLLTLLFFSKTLVTLQSKEQNSYSENRA